MVNIGSASGNQLLSKRAPDRGYTLFRHGHQLRERLGPSGVSSGAGRALDILSMVC